MDKAYANTVRLLLNIAPDVFAGSRFAMKGGTAINMFVRDMPRLSVDIDVVYTPRGESREQALAAITQELATIGTRLQRRGLRVRGSTGGDPAESRLIVEDDESQVKVEVNHVFRGTVLPVESRPLAASTAALFSAELSVPILATAELYGGKLVAAMDRQHPRDLFDVLWLYETDGLSDAAVECFVTYLAGHNRPMHEVLFGNQKDVALEYRTTFEGMTTQPVELGTLLTARQRLFTELPARLTDAQRRFLIGLARAEPDWSLLACPHAAELPALRWKLMNIERFKKNRPSEFRRQAELLEQQLR